MSKKKEPIFIPVNEAGLDDFFIWKHKIEKDMVMDGHIPYTKFITEYVNVGEHAFMNGDAQEVVPFSVRRVKDDTIVFYVPAGSETTQKFFDELKRAKYDVKNVPLVDIPNYKGDIEKASFFTDEGKMRIIN